MDGIDISNWQVGIKPSSMQIDFCIIKATEGVGFVDKCFKNWANELVESDKLFGFYHFARNNPPYDEAVFFYETTKNYIGKGTSCNDGAEKIRSINEKESNYFNIL